MNKHTLITIGRFCIAFVLAFSLVPLVAFANTHSQAQSGSRHDLTVDAQVIRLTTAAQNQAPYITGAQSIEARIQKGYEHFFPHLKSVFEDPENDRLEYSYRVSRDSGAFSAWTPIPDSYFIGVDAFQVPTTRLGHFVYEFRAFDGALFSPTYTASVEVIDPDQVLYDIDLYVYPTDTQFRLFACAGIENGGTDIPDYDHEFVVQRVGTERRFIEDGASTGAVYGWQECVHYQVRDVPRGRYSYECYGQTVENAHAPLGGSTIDIPAKNCTEGTHVELNFVRRNYTAEFNDTGKPLNASQYSPYGISCFGYKFRMGDRYRGSDGYTYTPIVTWQKLFVTLHTFGMVMNGSANSLGVSGTRAMEMRSDGARALNYVGPLVERFIIAPTGATVAVYDQRHYLEQRKTDPIETVDNGDGTSTHRFLLEPSRSELLYRMTDTQGDNATCVGVLSTVDSWNAVDTIHAQWSGYSKTDRVAESTQDDECGVLLNISQDNFRTLNSDQQFRMNAFRSRTAVTGDIDNYGAEPDFTYRVLAGADLIAIDPVVGASRNASNSLLDITPRGADAKGVALVEVGYDFLSLNGTGFPAVDPQRTGLAVFLVNQDAAQVNWGIEAQHADGFWDSEFDTVYFLAGEQGTLAFSPQVGSDKSIRSVQAISSADVAKGATQGEVLSPDGQGVYQAPITAGNNLLRVELSDGSLAYKVIRGAEFGFRIEKTSGDSTTDKIYVGDSIAIYWEGIHHPVPKQPGVYNPSTTAQIMLFHLYDGSWISMQIPLRLASKFPLRLTIEPNMVNEEGNVVLSDISWSSAVLGDYTLQMNDAMAANHRNIIDYGIRLTSFSATVAIFECDSFPSLVIPIERNIPHYDIRFENAPADGTIIVTNSKGQQIDPTDRFVFTGLEADNYRYVVSAPEKVPYAGTFSVSSAVDEGSRSIQVPDLEDAFTPVWDGYTFKEPQKVTAEEAAVEGSSLFDREGWYKISSAEELAWLSYMTNPFAWERDLEGLEGAAAEEARAFREQARSQDYRSKTAWFYFVNDVLYKGADYAQWRLDLSKDARFTGTTPPPLSEEAFAVLKDTYDAFFSHVDTYGTFSANCVLTANLDLGNYKWYPIGSEFSSTSNRGIAYRGTFDGAGHIITNMHVYQDESDKNESPYYAVGLFGSVKGSISNLRIKGNVDTLSAGLVGGLVGSMDQNYNGQSNRDEDGVGLPSLSNVSADVAITIDPEHRATHVGGIVGDIGVSSATNLSFSGSISGKASAVGGIAGSVESRMPGAGVGFGQWDNCSNTGTITVSGTNGVYVGGIIGEFDHEQGEISNCYNGGNVTIVDGKNANAGGIVGRVDNRYVIADVTQPSTVTGCINEGDITGITNTGGIVGNISNVNQYVAHVSDSVNYGNVSGTGNVGGIAGVAMETAFDHVVNSGSVTGTALESSAGGIAGAIGNKANSFGMDSSIEHAVNTGTVTSDQGFSGGIAGTASSTRVKVRQDETVTTQVDDVVWTGAAEAIGRGFEYIQGEIPDAANAADARTAADVMLDRLDPLADYSKIDQLEQRVPDLSRYTKESADRLLSALSSVNRSLRARDQHTVDAYAAAISQALAQLVGKTDTVSGNTGTTKNAGNTRAKSEASAKRAARTTNTKAKGGSSDITQKKGSRDAAQTTGANVAVRAGAEQSVARQRGNEDLYDSSQRRDQDTAQAQSPSPARIDQEEKLQDAQSRASEGVTPEGESNRRMTEIADVVSHAATDVGSSALWVGCVLALAVCSGAAWTRLRHKSRRKR